MFYALRQYQRGSETRWNGRVIDELHAFETLAEREAYVAADGNAHRLTAREAATRARECFGLPLRELERGVEGSRLRSWPTA